MINVIVNNMKWNLFKNILWFSFCQLYRNVIDDEQNLFWKKRETQAYKKAIHTLCFIKVNNLQYNLIR